MSKLLIIGAGGHGRVIADAALSAGWEQICFVDDRASNSIMGLEVIGRLSDLENLRPRFKAVAIGIGDARLRLMYLDRCNFLGFELPIIIHPSAVVSRFAEVGEGSVVLAQAAVNAGAVLGRGCIVNTGATVDHDCTLGDCVHVCPGANLAGGVRVGQLSWIGIGACVKQGVRIAERVTVGAGAAVVNDISPDEVVTGVPARSRAD